MSDKVLYRGSSSMFGSGPLLFLLLLFSVIGWPLLFLWGLFRKPVTLTITDTCSILRRSSLSSEESEVWHDHVRNVKIKQSFFQRLLGYGTLQISSSGQSDCEITAKGLRSPRKAKQIIDENRRARK